MHESELTGKIIGLAIGIHNELGPGLLENAYKQCLYYELSKAGLIVQKEVAVPLIYEGVDLECGYKIDLLIENQLVIEVKSVECINQVHLAQTLTYMRLGNYKLGLLINFNVAKLKDGIKRVVNNF